MKKLLFILIAAIIACKTPQKQNPQKKLIVKDLQTFFQRTEQDLVRAKQVVINKDLVINLSHLRFMNAGGKKYYLLERENITKMIESVTKGVYHDFILINKKGIIIYTKKNDSIFGKSIRGSLKETAVYRCYKNRKTAMNIEDVSEFPEGSGRYYLSISSKTKGKSTIPGIFILMLDISQLQKVIKPGVDIVGMDGRYKISYNHQTGKKFPCKDKLLTGTTGGKSCTITCKGTTYRHSLFSYSNLSWHILEKE